MIVEMSKWKTKGRGYEVVIGGSKKIDGVDYYCVVYDDFSCEIMTEAEIRPYYTLIGSLV